MMSEGNREENRRSDTLRISTKRGRVPQETSETLLLIPLLLMLTIKAQKESRCYSVSLFSLLNSLFLCTVSQQMSTANTGEALLEGFSNHWEALDPWEPVRRPGELHFSEYILTTN